MFRFMSLVRSGAGESRFFRTGTLLLMALMLVPATRLTWAASAAGPAGNVDAARLQAADSEPQNWYTAGRDKDGSYYSPLANIDAKNVGQLGFAWQYDLGSPMRGQEATPIVIRSEERRVGKECLE